MQKIIKSDNLPNELNQLLSNLKYDKLFVLVDTNTQIHCLSYIKELKLEDSNIICIQAGDENKNLNSLAQIWEHLSNNGATRHSLLINLGGGMLTDIGGFSAASFKRGIKFINIPTTLLGAVDAAVGGKTGINFNGLKNEIGAFSSAEAVIIDAHFFQTLDLGNILSGYAEIIKHGLISTEKTWEETLSFQFEKIDYNRLNNIVFDSVKVKEQVVKEDPYEHGIRKSLNLGHTIGHAFESLSHEKSKAIPHGYAVAWGIICELYLSMKLCDFPENKFNKTIEFINSNYKGFIFELQDYINLYDYMKHDKKNVADTINFTFLSDIGKVKINQTASKENIFEAIDFLRNSNL